MGGASLLKKEGGKLIGKERKEENEPVKKKALEVVNRSASR